MPVVKVWNGSAWVDTVAKVYSGAVWYDKMNLRTQTAWQEYYGAANEVTLSGTSGSPNLSDSFAVTDPSGATVSAGWLFVSDGTMDLRNASGNWANWTTTPTEWHDGTPASTFYLRATLEAGDTPDLGTLGTWQSLASSISYLWTASAGAFGFDTAAGTLKIEIAANSDGSNIRATGYYRGFANVSA